MINVPLKTMTNVANKTIKSYISNLNESEQNEVLSILNTPKEKLLEKYNETKNFHLFRLHHHARKSGSFLYPQELFLANQQFPQAV